MPSMFLTSENFRFGYALEKIIYIFIFIWWLESFSAVYILTLFITNSIHVGKLGISQVPLLQVT